MKCVSQGSTYEKALPLLFFSLIFCLYFFVCGFGFFFFFFLGIYLFSLNNIVRRHTTLTSLHREKIMWKAERQRKFKNISLLSRIQYVLYIQRRAKSILMKTVYNPGLQTPVFIKVSRFFSVVFCLCLEQQCHRGPHTICLS